MPFNQVTLDASLNLNRIRSIFTGETIISEFRWNQKSLWDFWISEHARLWVYALAHQQNTPTLEVPLANLEASFWPHWEYMERFLLTAILLIVPRP